MRTCENCSTEFYQGCTSNRGLFCSRQCFEMARRTRGGIDPELQRERWQRKNRRRRAAYSEPYTTAQIADRDSRVCGLCGLGVDMALSGLDPLGPNIDHIVPISWGGPDVPDNVQLAHRRCNQVKGDRFAEGVL